MELDEMPENTRRDAWETVRRGNPKGAGRYMTDRQITEFARAKGREAAATAVQKILDNDKNA